MGSLTLASREKLDNLIFVINCNLQRLDGPVRGNGKIIQELEAAFRGAGWNVIKVIWGERLGRAAGARHHRPAAEAHGRSGGRRIPDLRHQGRRLRPQEFLRQVSRAAGPGGAPERRRAAAACAAAATTRARSTTPTKRAVETTGPAHRDPGPDHQRLRPGRGRRRPQHHPPAEEAERSRRSRTSARASRSPFPTKPRATRRSTGRPRTARKWPTCTSAGACWAATCRTARARPPADRGAAARIPEGIAGRLGRAAKCPAPWPSSAC